MLSENYTFSNDEACLQNITHTYLQQMLYLYIHTKLQLILQCLFSFLRHIFDAKPLKPWK